MTYENIKTTILTFLVLLSGLLTWNIWTYQPNYESMENQKTVGDEIGRASCRERV